MVLQRVLPIKSLMTFPTHILLFRADLLMLFLDVLPEIPPICKLHHTKSTNLRFPMLVTLLVDFQIVFSRKCLITSWKWTAILFVMTLIMLIQPSATRKWFAAVSNPAKIYRVRCNFRYSFLSQNREPIDSFLRYQWDYSLSLHKRMVIGCLLVL